MGEARTAAPSTEAENRQTKQRSSHRDKRYSVDTQDGSTMGGSARTLWLLQDSLLTLIQVAQGRRLGPSACRATASRRYTGRGSVDNPLCRRHRCSRSPECSRCKKGDPEKGGSIGQNGEALGRSRGGFSTKIHVRCEGKGKPVAFVLTPGEQHECTVFEQLMEQGSIKRTGRGRPRLLPGRIVGDKGYSSKKIRLYLHRKASTTRYQENRTSIETVHSTKPSTEGATVWRG